MKITFEKKDEKLFFGMISSQKIFGELAEKLQKSDLDIPFTTIDLIIAMLSKIIVDNNFYSISFNEINEGKLRSVIGFMLGTDIWNFNPANSLWDLFFTDSNTADFISISKEEIWNYLLKNGIEI